MRKSQKNKKLSLSPTIEKARPEDIASIVALGFASFKENITSDWPYEPDYDKSLFSIVNFVNSDLCYVLKDPINPRLINGVIIFRKENVWWSVQPVMRSILMFIKPEKRSFRNAKALINKCQEYVKIEKLPLVFDFFAQTDVEKKKRLFEYLGFKDMGSFMVFLP